MFYLVLIGLAGVVFCGAISLGPRRALWASWPIALLLLPAWMHNRVGSLELDLRTAVAVAVLAGYALVAQPGQNLRWVFADLLVIFLVFVQAVSQNNCDELHPLTTPDIIRRWLLPYVMGRLFLGSAQDIPRTMRVVCPLCVILSLYAMFEAITQINPINHIMGKTFGMLEDGEGFRMGLKRAQGPMDHPIFFGLALVMAFPWSIEACRRSREPGNPRWWAILPFMMGSAMVATLSRGPVLAALCAMYALVFFRFPRLRIAMFVLAMLVGAGVCLERETMQEYLRNLAGETEEKTILITIDGEEIEYTGTKHRVLLFQVYADAIEKAGHFGFGYELQGIHLEPSIADRFSSIDNHYLRFYLQHGYLGLGAFLLLAGCVTYYLARAGWDVSRPESAFAGILCGAMFAVTASLVSVWFSSDFSSVWLFCAGLAGAIHTFPKTPHEENPDDGSAAACEAPSAHFVTPPQQLVPGWAPRHTLGKPSLLAKAIPGPAIPT